MMGLYFNTAATIEMVELVNLEFANLGNSKGIEKWRPKKLKFKKGDPNSEALDAVAYSEKVFPKANPGKKARWLAWLNYLHSRSSPDLGPLSDALPPPNVVTYPVPSSTDTSNVGTELAQLIYQALNDNNCTEIIFVVVPDTTVRIAQIKTLIPSEGGYSLAITLCTIELPKDITGKPIKKYTTSAAAKKAAKKKKA